MFLKKLLAALALLLWTGAAAADVLVDNVNGYSLDAQGRLVRFAAIWVGDDGKVVQLLQRSDRKPDRTRYRFDGKGRTLLPGLIDAHGHVMELGFGAPAGAFGSVVRTTARCFVRKSKAIRCPRTRTCCLCSVVIP